jgi:hypothetical protein
MSSLATAISNEIELAGAPVVGVYPEGRIT